MTNSEKQQIKDRIYFKYPGIHNNLTESIIEDIISIIHNVPFYDAKRRINTRSKHGYWQQEANYLYSELDKKEEEISQLKEAYNLLEKNKAKEIRELKKNQSDKK